jgi:hypothetical protein
MHEHEALKSGATAALDNLAPVEVTADEIRERLGLRPWIDVSHAAREQGVWPRRSGRTTKILVDAVAAVANGSVVQVFAWSIPYSRQLAAEVRRMSERLGLPAGGRVFSMDRRPCGEYKVFADHYHR